MDQPFLLPPTLFGPEPPAEPVPWTCVRTRSRAEKQVASHFAGRGQPCFVPILHRATTSHRRTRTTLAPLFPGYVFAQGGLGKADVKHVAGVVDILPATPAQSLALHGELWSIWRGLLAGSPLELVSRLEPGEEVEVVAGSLKGTRGRFVRWGVHRRLVLWVDVLGVGAAIEIDEGAVERAS